MSEGIPESVPPLTSMPLTARESVEMHASAASGLLRVRCDGDEPEAAKVIVVERDDHPARLFAATGWEVLTDGLEAGDLVLAVDGDEWVAQIGSRLWDSVCKAEAILPADLYARQGKKLAIATDALRDIAESGTDADDDADRALQALDAIAELDL